MSRPYFAPKQVYTGNGSLDTYTFDFKIEAKDQLLVVVMDASNVETERLRGDDVTYLSDVTFNSVLGGGEVVLLANLPLGYRIGLFLANDEPSQGFEFSNKTSFSLKRFENALDFIVGPLQRLTLLAKQSLRIHDMDDEDAFNTQLPPGVADNGDAILAIDVTGTKFIFGPTVTEIEGWKADAEAAAAEAQASADASLVSENAAAASAAAAVITAAAAAASAAAADASDTAAAVSAAAADASDIAASASAAAAAASAAAVIAFAIYPVQNISSGGTITLGTETKQFLKAQGNAGPQSANAAPFSGSVADGSEIVIEGQDDTKTLTIIHSDTLDGCINPNGGDIYLNKYSSVTYVYDSTAQRFKAISGNGI